LASVVRVVHASPDAPAVDVGLMDGDTFIPVNDFLNLSFGDASDEEGTALPRPPFGYVEIGVAPAGTTAPVATFDISPTLNLRAFAVAAGSLGGTGESFRLIAVSTEVFPWQAAEIMPN